jgi:hypothetical protein
MMTSQRATPLVLSHCHVIHGQQHDIILSGRLTSAATSRGGQQPVVVGGCIEASCWHITSTLPVDVAFKRNMHPLPVIVALTCVCVLGMGVHLGNMRVRWE